MQCKDSAVLTLRCLRLLKIFPQVSLAEFLGLQPQEQNENPSFLGTCASEMTLLMADGTTMSGPPRKPWFSWARRIRGGRDHSCLHGWE